jgi:hypothetical protein
MREGLFYNETELNFLLPCPVKATDNYFTFVSH